MDGRFSKKGTASSTVHIKHVKNTLSLVLHFQRLPIVTFTAADLARHIDVGQEMHLNLYDAVAAARLTASTLYIKTEPSLLIASRFRIRRARKQIAYLVENARVCRGVGAGRPADGRLVNVNHFVKLIDAQNPLMLSGNAARPV